MFSFSDLVFFSTLLGCIILGGFYKNIHSPVKKRNYGTALGILITCMICRSTIIHSILMVCGNIAIIKCCNKLHIHQLCLVYTWIFIIYMNYNEDFTNYMLWVHQAIALRLVGLAFEITLADKTKRQKALALSAITEVEEDTRKMPDITIEGPETSIQTTHSEPHKNGDLVCELEPSAVDIISYAYYFIGLHKGPYYTWKVFDNHFKSPFGRLGNCRIITEKKLKKAFIFSLVFWLLSLQFPVQVYYEKDFYSTHSTDFRYLYSIPQIIIYVLQYQVLMMLCASVCTEAGFGLYPTKTHPIPGYGPSAKLSLLNMATLNEEKAVKLEYNFAMIRSFENEKVLMGPRMRDTLRGWDMSVRYWFWAHTYKELVRANKEVRTALSFLAYSLWRGLTVQQLMISSTLWVHLHLEQEYGELYDTTRSMKMPWDIGFSIMRLFCLIYLTPCFILKDHAILLRYYNSIYWVYHMVLLLLIIVAVGIQKERQIARRTAVLE